MTDLLQATKQPEYTHVLLNHLPIVGLLVALVFLVSALFTNSRPAVFLALGLVALLALSVWPVRETGEAAYDRVLAMADDAGGLYLKHHVALADRWSFLYYVAAGAAVLAMVAGRLKPKLLRPAGVAVALLAAASLTAGAAIAAAGGAIRHREFRYTPPPPAPPETIDG